MSIIKKHLMTIKQYIVLILVLVVVLGVASFFVSGKYSDLFSSKFLNQPGRVESPFLQIPKGVFYLSLAPETGKVPLGIYSYDIASKELSRILVDSTRSQAIYQINISPSISPDGSQMAFSRRRNIDSAFQIYTSSLDGSNLRQITSTPEVFKREPVWDPLGKRIAYVSYASTTTSGQTSVQLPDTWTVYITDLSGKVLTIGSGVNPLFSPNGDKLLVLKNDGLHLYDISKEKSVDLGPVVKTIGGRASQTMKISLSHNKHMIAWSSPEKRNIVISKINSWDVFSITPLRTILTKAYWSIFSKDDDYLAVMEIRDTNNGGKKALIAVHELSTGKFKDVAGLGSHVAEYIWLGGWTSE